MRIKSVSYGFTKNLGNFQSQRVDCTVEIAEGDDVDEALDLAVAFVDEACGENLDASQIRLLNEMRSRVSGR